jgi:hypothetical protein
VTAAFVLLGVPLAHVWPRPEEPHVVLKATDVRAARAEALVVCRDRKWLPWQATLLNGRSGERIVFHAVGSWSPGGAS